MNMSDDFLLALSTVEVADATDIVSIKREMYNAMPWLSDFCKDQKLLDRENLSENTTRIIRYFVDVLDEEGRNIHNFSGAKLKSITSYDIRIRFMGYRD